MSLTRGQTFRFDLDTATGGCSQRAALPHPEVLAALKVPIDHRLQTSARDDASRQRFGRTNDREMTRVASAFRVLLSLDQRSVSAMCARRALKVGDPILLDDGKVRADGCMRACGVCWCACDVRV